MDEPLVELRYFEGCPNYRVAETRVREALRRAGLPGVAVRLERVDSQADVERLGFVGSPTILVNGVDPFLSGEAPTGMACRSYQTPEGRQGSPSIGQLVEVFGSGSTRDRNDR